MLWRSNKDINKVGENMFVDVFIGIKGIDFKIVNEGNCIVFLFCEKIL